MRTDRRAAGGRRGPARAGAGCRLVCRRARAARACLNIPYIYIRHAPLQLMAYLWLESQDYAAKRAGPEQERFAAYLG